MLKIVEKSSAILTPPGQVPTWEYPIPVNATHREMCRFASSEDGIYKKAVLAIKRIQHGCVGDVVNEHYVVPHSASLHFTGRDDIRKKLHDSLLSYPTPNFRRVFVLHGLGGSGKTQIALKFAEDNRDR